MSEDTTIEAEVIRPAASHDILEFRRCSCNALKPKAILAAPKTSPAASRYVQDADGSRETSPSGSKVELTKGRVQPSHLSRSLSSGPDVAFRWGSNWPGMYRPRVAHLDSHGPGRPGHAPI